MGGRFFLFAISMRSKNAAVFPLSRNGNEVENEECCHLSLKRRNHPKLEDTDNILTAGSQIYRFQLIYKILLIQTFD